MNRRSFILATGSAILGSTSIASKNPVLGLEFELQSIEDADPSNINFIAVDFKKFELTP